MILTAFSQILDKWPPWGSPSWIYEASLTKHWLAFPFYTSSASLSKGPGDNPQGLCIYVSISLRLVWVSREITDWCYSVSKSRWHIIASIISYTELSWQVFVPNLLFCIPKQHFIRVVQPPHVISNLYDQKVGNQTTPIDLFQNIFLCVPQRRVLFSLWTTQGWKIVTILFLCSIIPSKVISIPNEKPNMISIIICNKFRKNVEYTFFCIWFKTKIMMILSNIFVHCILYFYTIRNFWLFCYFCWNLKLLVHYKYIFNMKSN